MPRLLERLPESSRRRRGAAGRAGTVASVVAHATLITLAVVATGIGREGPTRPPKPIEEHGIYVDLPENETRHSGEDHRPRDGGPTAAPRREEASRWPEIPTFDPGDPGETSPGHPIVEVSDDFGRGGDARAGVGAISGDGPGDGSSYDNTPFDARVVEVPASLRPGSPVPRYPDALRPSRVEGRVVVRFVVDTAGRVEPASVRLLSSTHALFTSAVRATLPSLRFTPARARGTKVRQLVELPFEFEVE